MNKKDKIGSMLSSLNSYKKIVIMTRYEMIGLRQSRYDRKELSYEKAERSENNYIALLDDNNTTVEVINTNKIMTFGVTDKYIYIVISKKNREES